MLTLWWTMWIKKCMTSSREARCKWTANYLVRISHVCTGDIFTFFGEPFHVVLMRWSVWVLCPSKPLTFRDSAWFREANMYYIETLPPKHAGKGMSLSTWVTMVKGWKKLIYTYYILGLRLSKTALTNGTSIIQKRCGIIQQSKEDMCILWTSNSILRKSCICTRLRINKHKVPSSIVYSRSKLETKNKKT